MLMYCASLELIEGRLIPLSFQHHILTSLMVYRDNGQKHQGVFFNKTVGNQILLAWMRKTRT